MSISRSIDSRLHWRRDLLSALGAVLMSTSTAFGGEVVSATPTGSVKSVQQFLVKYSTDMVPMGDPRGKDPMTVVCIGNKAAVSPGKIAGTTNASTDSTTAVKHDIPGGQGRWVDSKTWSYDFKKPLSSGIRCTFTQVANKDLSGEAVASGTTYVFTTSGPAIVQVAPRYGEIEPGQYFVIETDGAMDMKSIEEHAYFETDKSIASLIGIKLITGPDREKVIRAAVETNWPWASYRELLKSTRPVSSMPEFNRFIVLAGKTRFPESSKIALHWPKQILSQSQMPVDEAQKFEFNVIAPFSRGYYRNT